MAEAALSRGVLQDIHAAGGYAIKTTGVALAGCPDVLGAYLGVALVWELKTPRGQLRPAQRVQLRLAAAAGADTAVIRTRAEARARLAAIAAAHGARARGAKSMEIVTEPAAHGGAL